MTAAPTLGSRNAVVPTYDVVIPCYNRAETVARAVDSVLAQLFPPERIILVDDGSDDDTAAVILQLERDHPIVQAVLAPRNMGASAARNAGLALTRAEWIGFLDSDDVWVPGAAGAMLGSTSDADVVVGRFRRVWRSGITDAPECGWIADDHIRAALGKGGAIGPSWSLIRRATAASVGGFDPSFHNCNDWDFYVRVGAAGARFARIDATVAHYHIAADNRLSNDVPAGCINAQRVQTHPWLAVPVLPPSPPAG